MARRNKDFRFLTFYLKVFRVRYLQLQYIDILQFFLFMIIIIIT